MKFFAATALAFAAATAVSAETCDYGKIAVDLLPLIEPATACQGTSGFTIIPPTALPTADEVKKICSTCTTLITAAKAVTFPTCTIPLGGKDVAISDLFSQIAGQCGGASTAAPGNSTTAPTNTTTAPTTTTTAPTTTTEAPAATTMAPVMDTSMAGSSSAAGDDDVKEPTETTASPTAATPAPTTSAGVSATLGAAVAVACSIAAFVL